MSLLPYVFGNEFLYPRSRLFDQDFGLALTPHDVLAPASDYRPWRQLARMTRDLGSTIKSDNEKFQVNVDVQHFAPEEISVKTSNGYVVIEGKHEEKRDDHGFVSRQFVRRYALPEGCHDQNVQSRLSSDGVLSVIAPKQDAVKGERAVPMQHTGPVRKEVTDNSEANSVA